MANAVRRAFATHDDLLGVFIGVGDGVLDRVDSGLGQDQVQLLPCLVQSLGGAGVALAGILTEAEAAGAGAGRAAEGGGEG